VAQGNFQQRRPPRELVVYSLFSALCSLFSVGGWQASSSQSRAGNWKFASSSSGAGTLGQRGHLAGPKERPLRSEQQAMQCCVSQSSGGEQPSAKLAKGELHLIGRPFAHFCRPFSLVELTQTSCNRARSPNFQIFPAFSCLQQLIGAPASSDRFSLLFESSSI